MVGRWRELARDRAGIAIIAIALILAFIPWIVATATAQPGERYVGATVGVDDQMVYTAWIHQAMSGRLLFDNRFTTAAQPGLTLHLYFLALGWLARFVGVVGAGVLGRFVFGALFLLGLRRFVERAGVDPKLGLTFSVFGGGVGFLVWQNFGREIAPTASEALRGPMGGLLPIDAWQTEAFVFPSLLENGLFMVALWLIMVILNAFLDVRENPRLALPGALAMAVLMNVHSYDVLLVGLVALGWLVAEIRVKQATRTWILACVAIFLATIPAALWFVHVLKNDPVFQARAATETYSANFRPVLFGIAPALALGLVGLWRREGAARNAWIGLAIGIVALFGLSTTAGSGYFLTAPLWALAFAGAVGVVAAFAEPDRPARNLVVAWAVIGLIAMYVPALFQRKLAEGMIIPWAILAVEGLGRLRAKATSKDVGRLVTFAVGAVMCASSLRWLARDLELIKLNVATTTVHPVTLSKGEVEALAALEKEPGRVVVAARTGVPRPALVDDRAVFASFDRPYVDDLNTIAAGLTGAYAVAGHWSETPKYDAARKAIQDLFYKSETPEDARRRAKELGVTHLILPLRPAEVRIPALERAGRIVFENDELAIVKVE